MNISPQNSMPTTSNGISKSLPFGSFLIKKPSKGASISEIKQGPFSFAQPVGFGGFSTMHPFISSSSQMPNNTNPTLSSTPLYSSNSFGLPPQNSSQPNFGLFANTQSQNGFSSFGVSQSQSSNSFFGNPQPQPKLSSLSSAASDSGTIINSSIIFEQEINKPQPKINESNSLFSASNKFRVNEEEIKFSVNKDNKALKVKLSCIICYEKFNTTKIIPKVLICGHSMCSLCLDKIFASKRSIICPLCSSCDNRLVLQIPVNFTVFEMCEENKDRDMCREHNKEIGLFCKNDHHLLCFNCVVQHSAHEILLLSDGYVEDVINKKISEINGTEEKINQKIDFCKENLNILGKDRIKIQMLIDTHIKEYEKAQKKLIEVLEKSSEALRQSLKSKYMSIFERNQKSIENYNNFTTEYKHKKEELEKLSKDFNNKRIIEKINCEVLQLDGEMIFPEIENVEDMVRSLEDTVNYKEEILCKFNENLNN